MQAGLVLAAPSLCLVALRAAADDVRDLQHLHESIQSPDQPAKLRLSWLHLMRLH